MKLIVGRLVLVLGLVFLSSSTGFVGGEDTDDSVLCDYYDQQAASLVGRVFERPFESEARTHLASRYSTLGTFSTIEGFTSRTAKYVATGSLEESVLPDRSSGVDFVTCDVFEGPFDTVLKSRDAGRAAAAELRLFSRSANATAPSIFEKATISVEELGGQCPLLFEWSRAALVVNVSDPGSLSPYQEEAAIRILVTLAAQGVLSPDLSNSCDVWVLISEYFSGRTDYPSGYIALIEAKECARSKNQKLILSERVLEQRLNTLRGLSFK